MGEKIKKSETTKEKKDFLTKNQIKSKYHITETIIKLLGNPDKIQENPYYRSAAPMQLFYEERVKNFLKELEENQPEILEKMRKYQKRSKKATKTKFEKTNSIIEKLLEQFQIATYNVEEIPELAENEFWNHVSCNSYYIENKTWTPSDNANVAYIRHKLTNYEEILEIIKGKVGKKEAYNKIRSIMDEKILSDYRKKLENHKKST